MATDTKEIEKKMADASVSGDAIYTSEARGSDELGEGTFKVPYKTIMQAMKRYGKEPFPVLYQDAKPDSEAAKEGMKNDNLYLQQYVILCNCFKKASLTEEIYSIDFAFHL